MEEITGWSGVWKGWGGIPTPNIRVYSPMTPHTVIEEQMDFIQHPDCCACEVKAYKTDEQNSKTLS